jgi:hypothetical protein
LKEYSIYASGSEGSQTVDYAQTKSEAEKKVALLNKQLKDGTYKNTTNLNSIEVFCYDDEG